MRGNVILTPRPEWNSHNPVFAPGRQERFSDKSRSHRPRSYLWAWSGRLTGFPHHKASGHALPPAPGKPCSAAQPHQALPLQRTTLAGKAFFGNSFAQTDVGT